MQLFSTVGYANAWYILDLEKSNLNRKFMATYNEVLNQVKSLAFTDQQRLLEELKNLVESGVEVAGEDEILPQTRKEMPTRNLNRWYGFLPKRVDALEFQLKLRQEWDD